MSRLAERRKLGHPSQKSCLKFVINRKSTPVPARRMTTATPWPEMQARTQSITTAFACKMYVYWLFRFNVNCYNFADVQTGPCNFCRNCSVLETKSRKANAEVTRLQKVNLDLKKQLAAQTDVAKMDEKKITFYTGDVCWLFLLQQNLCSKRSSFERTRRNLLHWNLHNVILIIHLWA